MEKQNVLLSVPGNRRLQGLYPIRCLRKKSGSGRPAGSADLCHQRPLRCLHSPPGAGHGDPRGDQPPGHCQPVCHHHQCQFRSVRYPARIRETLDVKDLLLPQLKDPSSLPEAALWNGPGSEFSAKASAVGVLSTENEDIRSLRELITYGLKGLAAYTKHANVLLKEDPELDAFLQKALAATLEDSLTAEDLTALALETGACGVQRHGPAGSGQHRSLRES